MSRAHAGTVQWFRVSPRQCVGPLRDYSPWGGQGWDELTLTSLSRGGGETQWPVERVKSRWRKKEKERRLEYLSHV